MLQWFNKRLAGLTGFEFRRAERPGTPPKIKRRGGKAAKSGSASQLAYRPPQDPQTDRLLRNPVFIISPVRSGSTLLRLLLSAHSRLHAAHELHIRRLEVSIGTRLGEKSMAKLDLETSDLEHLLWDRVMHRELVKTGKDFIVEKTPSNAFAYQRIATAWPDARFIFLLRHPASIAKSWHEVDTKKRTADEAALDSLRYMRAVERAKANLTGHTVRYEDLTDDPEATVKGICEFLGIDFELDMLEYGKSTGENFTKGLGDWKDKVRSGTVQAGRDLPTETEIPEPLREISAQWGYLDRAPVGTEAPAPAEAHAEIAQIWPKDDRIRVTGKIVGEPKGGLDRDWRLLMVLRGNEDTTLTFPAQVHGDEFDVSIPVVDDLAPPDGLEGVRWKVYLATDGDETRLRLGKHLDDIEDKKKIMKFPEQFLDREEEPLPVKPGYSVDNDLFVLSGKPERELEGATEDANEDEAGQA